VSRIFIDANLLCLIVAGTTFPQAIGRHKRLRAFTVSDFDAVYAIASGYSEVTSCPHVLAETSNLISQTNDAEAFKLKEGLKALLYGMHEMQLASIIAMERPEYLTLGLTDAVILALHETPASLLTVDLGLTLAAQRAGIAVVNYNWIRDSY
jgi:hypothetical protein